MILQKTMTLLVVDDEPDMREIVAFEFKKSGFNILMASNGKEAFEIIRNNNVDLVLSDVNMPNGSGIELFEKIKQECHPAPTVIFITACSSDLMQELTKMGVTYVFSKPFNRKDVFEKVLEILNQQVQNH